MDPLDRGSSLGKLANPIARAVDVLRHDGALGLSRRAGVSILRNLERAVGGWARALEQRIVRRSPDEIADLQRNRLLSDRHRGRRCFILGNGPSLGSQDANLLERDVTLVMNAFWKHEVVQRWQPTYYCLADPLYFDGSEPMSVFFSDILTHIRSTTFLVPLFATDVVRGKHLLPLEHTHFVAFAGALDEELRGLPDLATAVPGVQSVSQLAIMAAMYMGCSPIYLLGMDHDWLAKRGMDRHFYEGHSVLDHPVAHGDLDRLTYASDLEGALKLWQGYEQIRQIAVENGVDIFNATRGGFLDVFPRVEYESLFPATQ